MLDFNWLYTTVRQRFDSDEALASFLPAALTDEALAAKGDDRYLSAMTQRVFQAGVRHSVVDSRWPDFEEVFDGFDPWRLAQLGEADIERLMQEPRIIRDRTKLRTIAHNARFILDIRQEQGCGFGAFLARWPVTDLIGLWRLLAERGARLGGRSGAGFLRLVGKDSFLLTSDVVARLQAEGVVAKPAVSSQRDLQAVQSAFNALHAASGRPMCELSALMALSINPQF